MTSRHQDVIDLLREHSIDAHQVLIDSVSRRGYELLVVDGDSKRVMNKDGTFSTTEHEWPSPEVGLAVLRMMKAQKPNEGEGEQTPDSVVLLRRKYDLDPTDTSARDWVYAENQLDADQYDQYMSIYNRVSETYKDTEGETG
jgi:hypothetical protein